jgi:hypothetical protein
MGDIEKIIESIRVDITKITDKIKNDYNKDIVITVESEDYILSFGKEEAFCVIDNKIL